MNKLSTTLTMVALTAGLILTSYGAGAGGMKAGSTALQGEEKKEFLHLDTNGDGLIDMEEARQSPQLTSEFSTIDSNEDNQLDEAEFARFEELEHNPGQPGGSGPTSD